MTPLETMIIWAMGCGVVLILAAIVVAFVVAPTNPNEWSTTFEIRATTQAASPPPRLFIVGGKYDPNSDGISFDPVWPPRPGSNPTPPKGGKPPPPPNPPEGYRRA